MNRFQHFLSKVTERIQTFSVKGVGSAVGLAFLLATGGSLYFAHVLQPKTIHKIKVHSADEEPAFGVSLSKNDLDQIVERNIFNVEGKTGDDDLYKKADKKPKEDKMLKSDLPLKLIGVIFGGQPTNGLALIQNKKNKSVDSFLAGDKLMKNVELKEIWSDKIVVINGGNLEFIELELDVPKFERRKGGKKKKGGRGISSGVAANSYSEEGFERKGEKITLSQEFRQKLLSVDFAKMLQDAKAEPVMENGALSGFKLTRIREDSIYEKSGFLDDDEINEINGVPLTDTGQAIQLLNQLRGESEIEVRLKRGGSPLTITMQVK